MKTDFQDRATGALMGAFIGDALGLGPHWYYDLDEMRRDFGDWIDDYTTPKPGRYHEGLEAGDLSQAGYILNLTLSSLIDRGAYDEQDFCHHMDTELLARTDGTPYSGPGGYTSQSIRDVWQKRVENGRPWGEIGGHADTTEAIERTLAIAVRYAKNPQRLSQYVASNTMLTQTDDMVVSLTVAFNAVLGQLLEGDALDARISDTLMKKVQQGHLPFHAGSGKKPPPGENDDLVMGRTGNFASPDPLLTPGFIAQAAKDSAISIEPASKVSLIYGMPCAIYHVVPAAYYLSSRFSDDFESAVLHAVNGGGQNQARAMLTGALVGAQVGLSGIPRRFLSGLKDSTALLRRVKTLVEQVEAEADTNRNTEAEAAE
ncbi:ADP-ribosylglycohydrolase family protein [Alteromonas sp. H39]|uniref:ADP-ribosylglycohydrolase family protein n=1 Tax=Alteromonas sp. H39 TaxID=3389876 RepID=UPI0039E16E2F